MQNAEIELKFPVPSLQALEARLTELGFHLDTPRTFEANTLYDTPERTLRLRGELLRLREFGPRHILTHKRHPEREDVGGRYKVRIETETDLSDGNAMAEVFKRLGYEPTFRYEKWRREYAHPAASAGHVVLDETPIGIFAELEGPVRWIDQTLAALRIDPAQCLTDSYGRLFLAWKERTGSPAENLTFEEIGAVSLTA